MKPIFDMPIYKNDVMLVSQLPFDSNFFGIDCGKAVFYDSLSKKDYEKLMALTKQFEFVSIININCNIINCRNLAKFTGVFLTDGNLQFEKIITHQIDKTLYPELNIQISNNYPHDDKLLDVTNIAFKTSRFINDPFLNKLYAQNFYSHIVESSFGREDKYFVAAYIKNICCGYLLFFLNPKKNSLTLQLVATHPEYHRKGVFSATLYALEKWAQVAGIDSLIVGTQMNNIAAVNSYTQRGFLLRNASHVYHYWPHKNL